MIEEIEREEQESMGRESRSNSDDRRSVDATASMHSDSSAARAGDGIA
jgi:hypothetical protein